VKAARSKAEMLVVVSISAVAAGGCARTISRDELFQIQNEGNNETVNKWWYCGSNDRFAYFRNVRILGEREVRVARDQLKLKHEFPYTGDRKKWIQVPLGVIVPISPRFDPEFFANGPGESPPTSSATGNGS